MAVLHNITSTQIPACALFMEVVLLIVNICTYVKVVKIITSNHRKAFVLSERVRFMYVPMCQV